MAYSYTGVFPNQQLKNSGVFTPADALNLQAVGEWGGTLEHIQTQTISSDVAQVDFTAIKESKYDVHKLEIINAVSDTDDKDFSLRVSVGGTFDTGANYHRTLYSLTANGTEAYSYATTATQMDFTLNSGNASNEKTNSYIYIYEAGNSATMTFNTNQSTIINADGYTKTVLGGGLYDQTGTVDGFRIFMDNSGDIASGVFKLYGIKQL